MSVDDFIVNLKFFLPSKPLTKTILELNSEYLGELPKQNKRKKTVNRILGFVSGRSRLDQHQRVIAERLYRYLSSIAQEIEPNETQGIMLITDLIPRGIPRWLGLPEYTKIDVATDLGNRTILALEALTEEFGKWLLAEKIYQAAWGELEMLDKRRLQITPDHVRITDVARYKQEPPYTEGDEWEKHEYAGAGSAIHGTLR